MSGTLDAAAPPGAARIRAWEALHCTFAVARPARGIAVLRITGHDVGELGAAPMRALERQIIEDGTVDLFIDARDAEAASIEVSGAWAHWLAANRHHCRQVRMLTGSRFIAVTARFVRRFADLVAIMQIDCDPAAFERALGAAVLRASFAAPAA